MLEKLELIDFRNFEHADVSFSPDVNIIWGDNGQGKTNMLEAVHCLSFTKSMRTNNEKDLIRFNCEFSIVKGDDLEIRYSAAGRKVMLNEGVKIQSSKEWLGLLPVVFFGPQELSIVKNEPGLRRRFMDMALCQLKPKYTRALSEYNRAKEQKSKILRNYREKLSLLDTLPDFNEKMIQNGEIMIKERAAFAEKLLRFAQKHHSEISGGKENLNVVYITKENLRDSISEAYEREIASGFVLAGPHRDDLHSTINDADARAYASQGQAKTAALAFKLAERDILEEHLKEAPVMLLDDVLSELDGERQEYILNNRRGGQCLITDCDRNRLKNLNAGQTIHIRDGKICI